MVSYRMRDLLVQAPDYIEHASVAGPISTLVLAEVARIEGDHMKALMLYDKAISLAQAIRFVQYEALGYHLLALYLRRVTEGGEKSSLAAHMMRTAVTCYSQWGALAVVQWLDPAPSIPSASFSSPRPLCHKEPKPKALYSGDPGLFKTRMLHSSTPSHVHLSSFVQNWKNQRSRRSLLLPSISCLLSKPHNSSRRTCPLLRFSSSVLRLRLRMQEQSVVLLS